MIKQKRGKLAKNLTRDEILKIIDKTNEDFEKRGASINMMGNVFKKFTDRIIDSNPIYRLDPKFSTMIGLLHSTVSLKIAISTQLTIT